jgi:hypothetical protein
LKKPEANTKFAEVQQIPGNDAQYVELDGSSDEPAVTAQTAFVD